MRNTKQYSISGTEIQMARLKELAEKTDLSVSRVIHLMTCYMLYNAEGIERLKLLNKAFLGSEPPSELFLIGICNSGVDFTINEKDEKITLSNGKTYTWEQAREIIKTRWIEA